MNKSLDGKALIQRFQKDFCVKTAFIEIQPFSSPLLPSLFLGQRVFSDYFHLNLSIVRIRPQSSQNQSKYLNVNSVSLYVLSYVTLAFPDVVNPTTSDCKLLNINTQSTLTRPPSSSVRRKM